MTEKEKYHNDESYRERVKERSRKWLEKNKGRYRFSYFIRKFSAMETESLKKYIDIHQTILDHANEELKGRAVC